MKNLTQNWITEGLLDFEYKKYVLLAYLNGISKHFDESKLYPFLSDLVLHYNNLITIKENKKIASEQFPKKLTHLDFQNFKIHYEKIIGDENYMELIEEIVNFAIPLFEDQLKQGSELYEFVQSNISLFPIGIEPINNFEGYIFIKTNPKNDTLIYDYSVSIFEKSDEKFRAIKVDYITSYHTSAFYSYENIKIDLVKQYKKYAHPATYAVESKFSFPIHETLLPVVKRTIMTQIIKS